MSLLTSEIFYNFSKGDKNDYETLLILPSIKKEYLKLTEQNFFNDEVFYDLSSKENAKHVI